MHSYKQSPSLTNLLLSDPLQQIPVSCENTKESQKLQRQHVPLTTTAEATECRSEGSFANAHMHKHTPLVGEWVLNMMNTPFYISLFFRKSKWGSPNQKCNLWQRKQTSNNCERQQIRNMLLSESSYSQWLLIIFSPLWSHVHNLQLYAKLHLKRTPIGHLLNGTLVQM